MSFVPKMGTKTTTASLGSALFGKTRLAILALLYGQTTRPFYLSEIVRLAGVGRSGLGSNLVFCSPFGCLDPFDNATQGGWVQSKMLLKRR